ncbi:N-6 DNA methylase [Lentisphaera profundi]|uniref:site-specific DNA-methyltransferase (adenine-specific) n=1 Tax=Lentisphaera profundi TaxID=1658616 RepID=A0ABY7VMX1_9BACT|nr:type I restriction-modification system subunit M [Lentisphaera profundi]WDE95405.1 N-6 DNA methylase [Lentisphaera profundi]
MNTTTQGIVQKLWNLCNVLKDDGITYHQYVSELTYILFLKMAKETETESQLPEGYRWDDLMENDGVEQLTFYRELLVHLGTNGSQRVQEIFANANTILKHAKNLAKLVNDIDALDWYAAREEGLGDLYEGLLEKNANEKKSGAGQYFTPRVLIDSIVSIVKPQAGETIEDPACGTGGFIRSADAYIKNETDDLFELSPDKQEFQKHQAYCGVELVQDTHRLLLMNLMLHGIESHITLGDTLSPSGANMPKVDIIMANPPFGAKKGGDQATRDDFTYPTGNKQLAFLQHIYRGLKPGGRAAVVLPDNVLFEAGVGADIRRDLMNKCNLHTILRLPTGIFYAQGVKTNVLFFSRGTTDKDNTKDTWVYDMRSNMPNFGKRTPFTRSYFEEFEKLYGADAYGSSPRTEMEEDERWRKFSREWIRDSKGDSLDISWIKDDDAIDAADLPAPEVLASEAMNELSSALTDLQKLISSLEEA